MGSTQSFPRVSLSKDHTVLITGGNQGVGYNTAKWIAMMGATVIIACRSEERAQLAIEQMNTEYQELKQQGREKLADYDKLYVESMKLDNASLTSVKMFIEQFKSSGRKLNTLICNAGIGIMDEAYTEDGNERVFQVNYLSHFLIITKLLPIIARSGEDGRIISVSSLAHIGARFDRNHIQNQKGCGHYDNGLVYNQSKLYQVMHMYSLNRRIKASCENVTVNTLHPGVVETPLLGTFESGCIGCCLNLLKCCGGTKTPFQGAWTSINAAVNPELKGVRDVYFDNSKPGTTSGLARDHDRQEMLWKYSLEVLKDYLSEDDVSYIEGKRQDDVTPDNQNGMA